MFQTAPCGKNSTWIAFEGVDGSGKSTQIELLKNYLTQKGFHVFVFREPGGSDAGEKIRDIILDPTIKSHPFTRAYLFLASRVELLQTKVLPALSQKNSVVILDRYLLSTLAYQGYGHELPIEELIVLHQTSFTNYLPNLTFFLNLSTEEAKKRREKRNNDPDHFEKQNSDFFKRVNKGFEELTSQDQWGIIPINADPQPDIVMSSLLSHIGKFIKI